MQAVVFQIDNVDVISQSNNIIPFGFLKLEYPIRIFQAMLRLSEAK